MRKTLILFVALVAALLFSACEQVSAHSPPDKYQVSSSKSKAAVAADVSTPYIAQSNAVQATAGKLIREFALENKHTAGFAPALRGNQKQLEIDYCFNLNTQRAMYDLPPNESFSGFGFENSARAKI